jgi:hypothetical protein
MSMMDFLKKLFASKPDEKNSEEEDNADPEANDQVESDGSDLEE